MATTNPGAIRKGSATPKTRGPRHQQLAEALYTDITSGHLAIGARLPTEHELSQTHGLARGTVRAALAKLEDLGMIDRTPKRGTIVVASRPVGPYQPIATLPSDIVSLATNTRLVEPRSAEITLTRAMASRVGAPAGSRWFLIEGARATRQRPHDLLCWSEHYLRPDLPRDQLVTGHFTPDQVAAHHVTQTITAALLDDAIAAALHATPGTPALVITRTHQAHQAHEADPASLLSIGIHTHPADRYKITTQIPPP